MRRNTDSDLTWMVILLFGGLTVMSWLSEQPRLLQIVMLASAVAASYGWWALFRMRTTCNVANRTNPHPCGNNVRGLLSACYKVDHRRRKRKLIWARLLGRPQPPSPYVPPARPSQSSVPTAAGPMIVQYNVEGAGRSAIMLGCTLVTTVFTVLGGAISVVGLFADSGPTA